MANSIIKYTTTHNQAIGLYKTIFKNASGKVLTVTSNEYVESEGCCIITVNGELSSIDGALFSTNRETLTSVIFPEGLKYIKNCLSTCDNLRTIEFPSTLEKIEPESFYLCSNIAKLKFNGRVVPNANGAFVGVQPYGVLYRPSGVDYYYVMNSTYPGGATVESRLKLVNLWWVEKEINENAIEPTLSVNDLPTYIDIEHYVYYTCNKFRWCNKYPCKW